MSSQPTSRIKDAFENLLADMHAAVQIFAIYKPSASDTYLLRKFDKTYASWGFNVVQESLHRELVLTLMRIWEDADNVASIPSILKRLESKRILNNIFEHHARNIANRRKNVRIYPIDGSNEDELRKTLTLGIPKDRERAIKQAKRLHSTIKGMTTKALRKPELESLRRYRHEYLAHTSIARESRTEKTNSRMAKWGDEETILNMTIPIVHRLGLLIIDTDMDLNGLSNIWKKYSEKFWERFE